MMTEFIISIFVEFIAEQIKNIILRKKEENVKSNLQDVTLKLVEFSPEEVKYILQPFIDEDIELDSVSDVKNNVLKMIENVNIFLSYSWKDEALADKIEGYYRDSNIIIKRDKNNIEHWGSIRKYMESIRETDYVILIISDSYLKSVNCMYEINELMKDENYKNRIFPLVLEESIYKLEGRIEYIVYWEKKYSETKEKIEQIKNMENTSRVSEELHFIREISYSISEFLDIVSDMNNPNENELFEYIAERLTKQ